MTAVSKGEVKGEREGKHKLLFLTVSTPLMTIETRKTSRELPFKKKNLTIKYYAVH